MIISKCAKGPDDKWNHPFFVVCRRFCAHHGVWQRDAAPSATSCFFQNVRCLFVSQDRQFMSFYQLSIDFLWCGPGLFELRQRNGLLSARDFWVFTFYACFETYKLIKYTFLILYECVFGLKLHQTAPDCTSSNRSNDWRVLRICEFLRNIRDILT